MIAVDASVLIAYLDSGDAHHDGAMGTLVAGAAGEFLVHPITLAEVLVGGVRVGRAVSMREHLFAAGIRVAQSDEDQPLRLAELRNSSGLKLPDCCVLDVALNHRAMLATFDDSLAANAQRLGVVLAAHR